MREAAVHIAGGHAAQLCVEIYNLKIKERKS